jgi:hypothetical protein
MVYDIENDSCLPGTGDGLTGNDRPYKVVIVKGRLTIKRPETPVDTAAVNINFRCMHIFVMGELKVGTSSDPIPITDKFEITLYGTYAADTVVYDSVIEAGNKVIASIGLVELFGTGPAVPIQKMLAAAPAG